jgi:autotransporter-associated beta strand protein
MKPKSTLRFLLALTGSSLLAISSAQAQTFTWDGGGGDDNFGTAANWSPDGAPSTGSGVVLRFTGSTRTAPVNNYTTGDVFNEWRLLAGATSPFTITGNGFKVFKIENSSSQLFTINTAGIYSSGGAMQINPVGGNMTIGSSASIELDGNCTLFVFDNFGSVRTLTINGTLSNGNGTGGNGELNLQQTATVILTGTNDYGITTLSNANTTLRIGDGGTTGTLGTGNVNNLGGSLIFNRSNDFSVSNLITGTSGRVTKQGAGVLTLTNNNTYTGGTTISTGTIQVTNSSALGTGSASVAAGSNLFLNANSMTVANNITLNGTTANGAIVSGNRPGGNVNNLTGQITLNATSNFTSRWNDKTLRLSGKITGSGGLNFDLQNTSVGGRFFVTGATNDYLGATSVTGATAPLFGYTGQAMLYLGATNALPTTTALTLNYADLYLNGQSQTLPSISGSGSFSVQNGSTTAATLTLGSGDTTSTFSGTIKDNGFSVTNTAAHAPDPPTLPPTLVTGTVALTKIGSGSLTLTNSNTYTGTTAINGGTLVITGATQATSAITFASGKLGLDIASPVAAASATINFTGQTVLVSGSPTLASYTLLTASSITGTPTLAAPAPSGYALEVFGGNQLRLVQSNTYATWIAGFPGVGLLNGVNDDPDNDGIDNGSEMVLGGNPATGMDTALLPTIELVNADPDGDTTFSDYLLFTYRRTAISETALVAAACETDTDLVAPWTPAINAVSGVVIQEDINFTFTPAAPANTDRVRVYVPRDANTKLFGRLNVVVP